MTDTRVHGAGAVSPDKLAESKMPGKTGVFTSATQDLNGAKFQPGFSPIGQNNHNTPHDAAQGSISHWEKGNTTLNGETFQSNVLKLSRSDIVRPVTRTEGSNVEKLVESFRAGYLKGE